MTAVVTTTVDLPAVGQLVGVGGRHWVVTDRDECRPSMGERARRDQDDDADRTT